MSYIITKDKKFSLDGVNVVTFVKGDTHEQLDEKTVERLGDCCQKKAVRKAVKKTVVKD